MILLAMPEPSTGIQQELDQLEQESKKNRQVALIFMVVVITVSLSIMIFVTTRYIATRFAEW